MMQMVQKKDHNVSDGAKTIKTCLLILLLAQDGRWTVVEVPNAIMLKYQPVSKFRVRQILDGPERPNSLVDLELFRQIP